MDVTDANSNNGAIIQQYTCNGGGSEKWYRHFVIDDDTHSWRQYVNYRTGKCLDVPSAAEYQVVMQQYRCTDYNIAQIFLWPSS